MEGGREAGRQFSQERVAQKLHLSVKAYRAYESDREPNYIRRREIAAAFGLDPEYFETPEPTARDLDLRGLREEVAALRGEVAQLQNQIAPQKPRRAQPRSA